MNYHADRSGKSSFEKNAFKVLSAFRSKSRATKARTLWIFFICFITLDLCGIFAIDFHRNKPKTIHKNNLLKKIDYLKILDVCKALILQMISVEINLRGGSTRLEIT